MHEYLDKVLLFKVFINDETLKKSCKRIPDVSTRF